MAPTTAVAPHWRCTITRTASAETETTDYVLQRLRTTLSHSWWSNFMRMYNWYDFGYFT